MEGSVNSLCSLRPAILLGGQPDGFDSREQQMFFQTTFVLRQQRIRQRQVRRSGGARSTRIVRSLLLKQNHHADIPGDCGTSSMEHPTLQPPERRHAFRNASSHLDVAFWSPD